MAGVTEMQDQTESEPLRRLGDENGDARQIHEQWKCKTEFGGMEWRGVERVLATRYDGKASKDVGLKNVIGEWRRGGGEWRQKMHVELRR